MGTRKRYSSGLNGAVATILRGSRSMAGLSIEDLAERSGIPYQSVRRYLAMERAIDMDVLNALAKAMDLTAAEVTQSALERLEKASRKTAQDRAPVRAQGRTPIRGELYEAVRAEAPLKKAAAKTAAKKAAAKRTAAKPAAKTTAAKKASSQR